MKKTGIDTTNTTIDSISIFHTDVASTMTSLNEQKNNFINVSLF